MTHVIPLTPSYALLGAGGGGRLLGLWANGVSLHILKKTSNHIGVFGSPEWEGEEFLMEPPCEIVCELNV